MILNSFYPFKNLFFIKISSFFKEILLLNPKTTKKLSFFNSGTNHCLLKIQVL